MCCACGQALPPHGGPEWQSRGLLVESPTFGAFWVRVELPGAVFHCNVPLTSPMASQGGWWEAGGAGAPPRLKGCELGACCSEGLDQCALPARGGRLPEPYYVIWWLAIGHGVLTWLCMAWVTRCNLQHPILVPGGGARGVHAGCLPPPPSPPLGGWPTLGPARRGSNTQLGATSSAICSQGTCEPGTTQSARNWSRVMELWPSQSRFPTAVCEKLGAVGGPVLSPHSTGLAEGRVGAGPLPPLNRPCRTRWRHQN